MKTLFATAFASFGVVAADKGFILGDCSATIFDKDGYEISNPKCQMFSSEQQILNMRPTGRILTSSGSELRQYEELTDWLIEEEYKNFHNLDLDIVRGQEPVLQIMHPKQTWRVKEEIPLSGYTTKSAIEALLARMDFERTG